MGRAGLNRVGAGLTLAAAGVLLAACGGGSPEPAPTPTSPTPGGTATCDETSLTEVIRTDVDETYPGTTFVALTSFVCVQDWAVARVDVETADTVLPAVFFLRAEGPTWVPTSIEDICATPAAESDVPPEVYTEACGVPE